VKGLQWDMRIAADAPRSVFGDSVRIQQIVLNLANNAIKFTEHGGVTIELLRARAGFRIVVRDTGPGMSDELRARLFQRFEQAEGPQRSGSSGLGLAICRELVGCMNGEITLDTVLGKGSAFYVDLPLPEVEPVPDTRSGDVDLPLVESSRILLVEDDATVAIVLTALLQAQGHCVRHVGNGLAAIGELAVSPYDVAFIDLDLPGIDGLALARILRNQERNRDATPLKLIAITARSGREEEARSIAAGMDMFLRKPISGAMLNACLIARDTDPTESADRNSPIKESPCNRI
jgi:CheY-like chemotaxis protein